jgi:hypothetical protein
MDRGEVWRDIRRAAKGTAGERFAEDRSRAAEREMVFDDIFGV